MDKQRKEFEKFSVETMKFRIDDCNDPYVKGMNERDWKIWQAAQAAMQPETDRLNRMEHDFPKLMEFFTKHGLGSKQKSSCLMCGKFGKKSTSHAELPDVYICTECVDNKQQLSAANQRIAELEATIKASQEQEPVLWVDLDIVNRAKLKSDGMGIICSATQYDGDYSPLYAKPVIKEQP